MQAFFTDTVIKQVDVPTVAGVVGVLAKHVPTLGVLKPGVVQVTDLDGECFVSSPVDHQSKKIVLVVAA